jgi:hypothetical protein
MIGEKEKSIVTTAETIQKQTWLEVEHPTYYANIMGLGLTPFDIGIVFGEVTKATGLEVLSTPKAKVILSPEQVSNLIKMLTAALNAYVNQYGTIRKSGQLPQESIEVDIE